MTGTRVSIIPGGDRILATRTSAEEIPQDGLSLDIAERYSEKMATYVSTGPGRCVTNAIGHSLSPGDIMVYGDHFASFTHAGHDYLVIDPDEVILAITR